MELPVKPRAMAYITHGNRLLVFRQPDFPEAGIQVPGGSIEPGEPLETAALREAFEETGLEDLVVNVYLGDVRYDLTPRGRAQIQHRHYFHLLAYGDVQERWEHYERDPSEGDHDVILFELFWVDLPNGVPSLIADMDEMVPRLLAVMGMSSVADRWPGEDNAIPPDSRV